MHFYLLPPLRIICFIIGITIVTITIGRSFFIPEIQAAVNPATNTKRSFTFGFVPRCDDVAKLTSKFPNYTYYHWHSSFPLCRDYDHYVPMIYSPSRATEEFLSGVTDTLLKQPVNKRAVLGPNECEGTLNCNATAKEVAQLWKIMEDRYLPLQAKLIFTVATHYQPDFIWEVVDEYQLLYGRLPHIDKFTLHIYLPEEQFKAYVAQEIAKIDTKYQGAYKGKPVWITEFGPNQSCPTGQNYLPFMQSITQWLENHPRIEKYFWFTTRIDTRAAGQPDVWAGCSLIDPSTSRLNPFGREYAQVAGPCSMSGQTSDHNEINLSDYRFLCWDGKYKYCGQEPNQWLASGITSAGFQERVNNWTCDGTQWRGDQNCYLGPGFGHYHNQAVGSMLCWNGRYHYCGTGENTWLMNGVITRYAGNQQQSWNCNGQRWISNLPSASPSPSPGLNQCPSDLNADKHINSQDLLILLSYWGNCGLSECPADINHDQLVNITDLITLLNHWGECF